MAALPFDDVKVTVNQILNCHLSLFFHSSGISCITTVLVPENDVMRTLLLFLLSKFLISASFLIIYPFAGEIYPTQVRGVGIGTSSYIGGIGLMIIPFVTYLVRLKKQR